MVVDSHLELFTTMFGWMLYNSIWFVLRDTGLLFLPFFAIVLDQFIDYREGNSFGSHEARTIKTLEIRIFLALIVLVFAGVPAVTLQANEVSYTPRAMLQTLGEDEPGEVTAEDSDTTYGSTSFLAMPDEVKVPVFFHLVFNLSSAINVVVMDSVPPAPAIREYIQLLNTNKITDPDLARETSDFIRDCYSKARSKYLREDPSNDPSVEALLDEYGLNDPDYVGSQVYLRLDGYYDNLRSATVRPPFLYSSLRDVEWEEDDPRRPQYGRPTCQEWWDSDDGLKDRMVNHTGLDTISEFIEGVGWDTTKRRDALIKNALENSGPIGWTPRGYDYAYTVIEEDADILTLLGQGAADAASVLTRLVSSAWMAGTAEVSATALMNSSAPWQAITIMFVVAFLPLMLAAAKFDFRVAILAGLALFTLKFLTVVWFIVWWLDQNLWQAMFPDPGMITSMAQVGLVDKRMFLSSVINSMYYVAPGVVIVLFSWAGYNTLGGLNSLKSKLTNDTESAGKVTVSQVSSMVRGSLK